LRLGRKAGAGAATDDRLALADHVAEFLQDFRAGYGGHGRSSNGWLATCPLRRDLAKSRHRGLGEFRVVDVKRQALMRRRSVCRIVASSAENSAASASLSQNAPPSMSSAETPFSGIRKRTGPSQAL